MARADLQLEFPSLTCCQVFTDSLPATIICASPISLKIEGQQDGGNQKRAERPSPRMKKFRKRVNGLTRANQMREQAESGQAKKQQQTTACTGQGFQRTLFLDLRKQGLQALPFNRSEWTARHFDHRWNSKR